MASEWTVETLKQYIDELRKSDKEAISIALASAKEAVIKAENSQRDYNQTHNDLLRKMDEQHKETVPRTEFTAYKESNEKALALEKERSDKDEGKGRGLNAFWGYIISAVSLAVTVITLITLINKT